MKKTSRFAASVLKAFFAPLLLAAALGFSSCSDDGNDGKDTQGQSSYPEDGKTSPLSNASITELNEAIIIANAYVAQDSTLASLKSDVEEAEKLLSSSLAKDSDAEALVAEIKKKLDDAKSSVTVTDTSFESIAGSSQSRAYKGLFKPTILKTEYDGIWLKYITPLVGTENAAQTATMLKSSISAPSYGKNVSEEQKKQGLFNCEFHPLDTVLTFSSKDGAYALSDGTKTYTYEYLGLSHMGKNDNWHALFPERFKEGESRAFDCSVYKAKESDAGEYKYVLLCPDTPEETYHIEFRYGANINDLQSALDGEYAFWLAAGIPSDADEEMIENVIKLFVEENVPPATEYAYALVNIPFEEFFKEEAQEFDAYTNPTTKAAAGNMSYGTYHTQETSSEATTRGITYPVKIAKASLSALTGKKITDDSTSFEVTTTARGKSSTIRYSGKQNLFQSEDYSYYVLDDAPAFYKELSAEGGSVSAGKIVGNATKIERLYVTITNGEAHHDFSPQITMYIDDPTNAGKVTKLTFSDEAEKAAKVTEGGTEEQPLSALKAIIATDTDGKKYGLTTLSNFFWAKSQMGFKAPKSEDETKSNYPQHPLVGKQIAKLSFITQNGLHEAENITVGTVAENVFTAHDGDEAKFIIPNLQGK